MKTPTDMRLSLKPKNFPPLYVNLCGTFPKAAWYRCSFLGIVDYLYPSTSMVRGLIRAEGLNGRTVTTLIWSILMDIET